VVVQHLPLGGLLEWNVAGAPPIVGGSVSRSAANEASSDSPVNEVPLGSSSASISKGKSADLRLNSHPKGS
jgi:hypothetical protein